MPLLDHFHPPLYPGRHWESFHAMWAGCLAGQLNTEVLPEGYCAEVTTHVGLPVEIDVATFAANGAAKGVATATRTWSPPAAPLTLPGVNPDTFEVRVIADDGSGLHLVAAIELVSPGNKDREEARRALAIKSASYLVQGIGLIVIDIVTNRSGNLHHSLIELMKLDERYKVASQDSLYTVAYGPTVRGDEPVIDCWPALLQVGQTLPTQPLFLRRDLSVPVDFEAAYAEACSRLRI